MVVPQDAINGLGESRATQPSLDFHGKELP
jgi:hypothetical protein